jgi:ribosomal protein S15P/S13E
MSATPAELLDLIATHKDTILDQGEQIILMSETITGMQEQVALLTEAINNLHNGQQECSYTQV